MDRHARLDATMEAQEPPMHPADAAGASPDPSAPEPIPQPPPEPKAQKTEELPPEETMARHEEQTRKKLARAKKKMSPAELKALRKEALERAHAAKALKQRRKEAALLKAEKGEPLTPQERQDMLWSSTHSKKENEKRIIDAAASLVIKPQTVEELRLVVERTAARYQYNPIESLIKLASKGLLDPKDEVAVHKALLPFLAPQLPQPKVQKEESDGGRVKVIVTQFVFQSPTNMQPLHTNKPKTVEADYVALEETKTEPASQ